MALDVDELNIIMPTRFEIEILKKLVDFLRNFYTMTNEMSALSWSTASLILPICYFI